MSIQDVRDFLLGFKLVATGGSGIDIVPRAETKPTLARLGLTKANLEDPAGFVGSGLLPGAGARPGSSGQCLDFWT